MKINFTKKRVKLAFCSMDVGDICTYTGNLRSGETEFNVTGTVLMRVSSCGSSVDAVRLSDGRCYKVMDPEVMVPVFDAALYLTPTVDDHGHSQPKTSSKESDSK